MNQRLSKSLEVVFEILFYGVVLAIPFFFWNLTSEFYETPKFIILGIAVLVLFILWGVRSIISGKFAIIHTPLDFPFLLLLVAFILSTFFAESRAISILGNLPRLHGGLASYVLYVLFFLVTVSNIKKAGTIRNVIYLLLGSGVVLAILELFSFAGLKYLPMSWTEIANFTPTGSIFSTNAILILLLPFLLIGILKENEGQTFLLGNEQNPVKGLTRLTYQVILSLALTIIVTAVILTGSLTTYLAGALVIGLSLIVIPQKQLEKNAPFLIFASLIVAIVTFLSFAPIGGDKNILHTQVQNYPRELQLPFTTSWNISVSTFRDSPIWGSGPATYLFDFTAYKPLSFNNTPYWNIRFDSAFNEYLQILATTGIVGLIVLMLLTAIFVSRAAKVLSSHEDPLHLALALSGIAFFILLLLHASTLVLWMVGVLILGLFLVKTKESHEELQLGIIAVNKSNNQLNLRFDALPMILMLIIIVLVGTTLYYGGKFVLADMHHRNAIDNVSLGLGLAAYNELVLAEGLNPHSDLYRIDLAQTNFALANAIAVAKGPTEASPAGSLTDQDKQDIQTLLSQAINEGKNAAALSPKNALNWEILGSIYRQISGVAQNALSFSLDAYGRAIQQDPLNPNLRLTVGGIYYSIQNYDMAIRFFTDAANLKPDFANAYYNLAVALKDKGDLVNAASMMEKTVTLLDPTSTDYKAASELLSDLRTQVASQEAALKTQQEAAQRSAQVTAPASEESSALQNTNLPKVVNLPKEESVATPEAVKE